MTTHDAFTLEDSAASAANGEEGSPSRPSDGAASTSAPMKHVGSDVPHLGTQAPVRSIKVSAEEEAALVAILGAKKRKEDLSTAVKPGRSAPPVGDIAGWQKIVKKADWKGLRNEDILKAYDHFRSILLSGGGMRERPEEYELAWALRRQLAKAALALAHCYIPVEKGPRASEFASARETAVEHLRAGIDRPTTRRGLFLRDHFASTARFVSRASLEHQFGRKNGNRWRDPKLRLSLDVDPTLADDVDDNDHPEDIDEGTFGHGKEILDRMGLRRTLGMQMALTAAIEELPTIDHQLIALWSYIGYNARELAPLFDCSEPTIAARLRTLARSPHLERFRK